MTNAPQKLVPGAERTVALTAIATAKLQHKHVGIRPKNEDAPDERTSGILVCRARNTGTALDEALDNAAEAWPDDNLWEVFGADDFESFPEDDSFEEAFGDGYFDDPCVYGEFSTLDDPGCLGEYAA